MATYGEPKELANLNDLADTFGEAMDKYEENYGELRRADLLTGDREGGLAGLGVQAGRPRTRG